MIDLIFTSQHYTVPIEFMKREFTSSVYILENHKVLLLFHPKLQKWLPPGGHLEPNETPAECAHREVFEETGLQIEFLSQEKIDINFWNAKNIETPYLTLLENIPAYKDQPAHQHIDFVFIARPIANCQFTSPFPCRWFSIQDLSSLEAEEQIFEETLKVLAHLFKMQLAESPGLSDKKDLTDLDQ